MTKPAHDGDWYFAVSGIEFYGHLIEGQFERTATPLASPEEARLLYYYHIWTYKPRFYSLYRQRRLDPPGRIIIERSRPR